MHEYRYLSVPTLESVYAEATGAERPEPGALRTWSLPKRGENTGITITRPVRYPEPGELAAFAAQVLGGRWKAPAVAGPGDYLHASAMLGLRLVAAEGFEGAAAVFYGHPAGQDSGPLLLLAGPAADSPLLAGRAGGRFAAPETAADMNRLLEAIGGSQGIPSPMAGAVAAAVAALPGDPPWGVAEEVLARVLLRQEAPGGQIALACTPVYVRR
jgi:hypothetical protein